MDPPRRVSVQLFVLAAAALVAYGPGFRIPLIADDYPNIAQSLSYGTPEGMVGLLADAQFRLRATSYWSMYGLWKAAGPAAWAYHAASVALHIAATWLLWMVASAWPRMRPAAFWAALFFAVYEGHQEAVMWFSAINELLMFVFGMAALWCWMAAEDGPRGWLREATGVVLFALALLSKESAVVMLPLFVLAIVPSEWRKRLPRLAPHVVLVALAVFSIAQSRANSFRFSDGSFSLGAPFWLTWPHSMGRLLWVFGWLALLVLRFAGRGPRWWRELPAVFGWMGIALLPYSFLTYSTRIPSRQVYLASAGLALLVGMAVVRMAGHRLAGAALAAMLVINTATLWTKKQRQFKERAAPTEALLDFARKTPGPIWVECFPLPPFVAGEAMHLALGRPASDLVWVESVARERGAPGFCYRDPAGSRLAR